MVTRIMNVLVLSLAVAAAAEATPVVTSVTGGNPTTIGGGPGDAGWEFTVNAPLEVTALGFWDGTAGTPLAGNHEVGIWDLSGTLVADGTVLTNSPFVGAFRYVDIAPILLNMGQTYRIAAFVPAVENDTWDFNASFTTDPSITILRGISSFAGQGFVFPTAAFGGNGVFGPNFQADVVPEPASLTLLGIGLAGFAARRRSRR